MGRLSGAVVLAVVTCGTIAAQLTVDVGLVNVIATVLDERGRYVAGLAAADFLLYEDGESQTIAHFAQADDLPVSVGIILDTSGSMERKIETARRAVERFLREIHPDDEIFLVTFDDRARLIEDFTSDRSRLGSALRRVRVGGGTALYDAVALGVDHIRGGRHDKKAILLISDGEDTSSVTSFERAQRDVRESEMLVYALGIAPEDDGVGPGGTPPTFPTGGTTRPRLGIPFPGGPTFPPVGTGPTAARDSLNLDVLELFAAISGGRAWLVSGFSDDGRRMQIADALDLLADELRNQYSLGYYPAHSLDDGQWHEVEVVTRDPAYRVRHREEYFGGSEQR